MKKSLLFISRILVMMLLLGSGLANDLEHDGVLATPYALVNNTADPIDEVAPFSITCTPWSYWTTTTSYCKFLPMCILTTLPFEVAYDDQFRWRECTSSRTGDTVISYDFREIMSGCCGMELTIPD